jgi:hypothetical protein
MKKVLVKMKMRMIHDMIGQSGTPPRQDKIKCTYAYRSNTPMKRDSQTETVLRFWLVLTATTCVGSNVKWDTGDLK